MRRLLLTISLLLMALGGCSNQYREADEVTVDELLSALNQVQEASAAGSTTSLVSEILKLQEDPNTYIYYSYGPGPLGPPASVAAILSFDRFGFSDGDDFDYTELAEVQVFFFDTSNELGRQFALILGVRKLGETSLKYIGMKGTGAIGEKDLYATLEGENKQTLIFRSNDIDDGELATVIQLRVYEGSSGGESFVGKFSTLVGFQP
jgi:hypothetical protein